MISYRINKAKSVIRSHQPIIDDHINEISVVLTALISDNADENQYTALLLSLMDTIITATPEILENYKAQFDAIISPVLMRSEAKKDYRDEILSILGYSAKRSDFYPDYFLGIGIKACVYCNSQLTVSVDSEDKRTGVVDVKAKFQVDHYWPKSDYPCFSISLFNLYPVCASCNNCKSTKKVDFLLYADNVTLPSKFTFGVVEDSRTEFLLDRDIDKIKLTYEEPSVPADHHSFKETFDIQGIYDTQKDLAAELILKAVVYTPSYKRKLMDNFPEIFTDINISNRLIIGNYCEESEIHKRPMAKFTYDIAKQLGLI